MAAVVVTPAKIAVNPADRVAAELVVVHLSLHVHPDQHQVEKEIILQQLLLKEMMVQLNF